MRYLSLKSEGFISKEKETKTDNTLMICVQPRLLILFPYFLCFDSAMGHVGS